MSTAPSTLPTGISRACHTPLSYFERLLDLEFGRLRIFGLILVETLGAYPHPRKTTKLTPKRAAETFNISTEWASTALQSLIDSHLVNENGDDGYSIADEYVQESKGAGRPHVRGKCPECDFKGLFSTEFIPSPHAAFSKMGACVDSKTYRVVMVVCRFTLKWCKESRSLKVEPHELSLHDFTSRTGLEKREISDGLTMACKMGLIGRETRAGRPSLFWAIPEAFGKLERRGPRLVEQPARGKETAKQESQTTPKNTSNPTETHAIESRPYFYARCPNCAHFVDVLPVSDEEFAKSQDEILKRKPAERARAGPIPQPFSSFEKFQRFK